MYSCVFWCEFIYLVGFFGCYCLTPVTLLSRGLPDLHPVVLLYVEPKCQTATYQKSNIIRCIRVWNVVADELNLRMNALNDW